jgi:hypothetical protein
MTNSVTEYGRWSGGREPVDKGSEATSLGDSKLVPGGGQGSKSLWQSAIVLNIWLALKIIVLEMLSLAVSSVILVLTS